MTEQTSSTFSSENAGADGQKSAEQTTLAQAAVGSLGSLDTASVQTPQGATVQVTPPDPGDRATYIVHSGDVLELVGEAFASGEYALADGGLLITLPDGAVVFVAGFEAAAAANPPLVLQPFDAPAVFASDVITVMTPRADGERSEAAAGASDDGGGAGFTVVDLGVAPQGLETTGPLSPQTLDFATASRPVVDGAAGDGANGPSRDAPNLEPIANADALSGSEDRPLDVSAETLMANDGDPDGDPIRLISVQNAKHGEVTLDEGGTIRFTPEPNFHGEASFDYTITDGKGGTATATATVNVAGVNDAPVATDDAGVTVGVGGKVVLDPTGFLSDDYDLDGDALTITQVDNAENGRVFLNEDGLVVFEASDAPTGKASFEYTISDGRGGTDTATVTINFRPVATNDANVTIREDRPVLLDPEGFVADDFDADGDALSLHGVGNPQNGQVWLENGKIKFVPDPDYNGPASFDYTITDGNGGYATATVSIDVLPAADAPRAGADSVFTNEDAPVYVDAAHLLANDSDPDGDPVRIVSVKNAAHGTVELLPDGRIKFTPEKDFDGQATFEYTIADPDGHTADATVRVDVLPVNDAPRGVDDARHSVTAGGEVWIDPASLLANDVDVDGDSLTLVAVHGAVNGSVTIENGQIKFVAAEHPDGPAKFDYVLTDGKGKFDTATARVNFAPKAADDGLFRGVEDTPLTIDPAALLANDSDIEGGALEVVWVGNPSSGSVSLVDGEIVFTPAKDHNGLATFEYAVSDSQGGVATAKASVDFAPVNDAPIAENDYGASVAEDRSIRIPLAELLANDRDAEGDALTITAVGGGVNGSARLDGDAVVFTPDPDFFGRAGFEYTVSDGKGGTDSAHVSVDVWNTNDAPVANADVAHAEAGAKRIEIDASELLANDLDIDGDALKVVGVHDAKGGEVWLEGSKIVFASPEALNSDGGFSYSISDGKGGFAVGHVRLNLRPEAADDAYRTAEDTPLTIDAAALLANDGDPEGGALTLASAQNAKGGTVTLEDGKVTFTPDPNFHGEASFEYTVTDPDGGSSVATVTLDVLSVNDAPNATDNGGFSTKEDTAISIDPAQLLADDVDVDGDAITFEAVQKPVGGSVAIVNGKIVFTPAADYSGEASFEYVVTDGKGGWDAGRVTVEVEAVNDVPLAADDAGFRTLEDTALTIDPAALLANDSDADGDPITFAAVQKAVGGTAALVDGKVVFTPEADFNGEASFEYVVTDGQGGWDAGRVTVQVDPVQDAPEAENDYGASVAEDSEVRIPIAHLVANDRDVDGDALTITAVGGALNGSVRIDGEDVVFTPNPDFFGRAGFEYTVSDGKGGTDAAHASVDVWNTNDAPSANADVVHADAGAKRLVIDPADLLGNDTDIDGDTLSVVGAHDPTGGQVWIEGGKIVFASPSGFGTNGGFSYSISDGKGGFAAGQVRLDLRPEAGDDADLRTAEDTPLMIDVAELLANDADPEGGALTLASVQDAKGGTVSLLDGKVVFVPDPDYHGDASFRYTVVDPSGGASVATVSIDVLSVNDAPNATDNGGFATLEDQAISIDPAQLLADDEDVEGDPITLEAVQKPVGGSVAIVNGKIVFTPDPDHHGEASFEYVVHDGQGGWDAGKVTVDVTAVNDIPVATDHTGFRTDEDTPLTIDPATLLADDTDADGDPITFAAVQKAVGGTAAVVDGKIVFTPDPDYHGDASFEYVVTDGQGGWDAGRVAVQVDPVQDAPEAENDYGASTAEDAPIRIPASELLANDRDVDGDAVKLTAVGGAVNGSVRLDGDDVVFTPDRDFFGRASFEYTISDGAGGSATAMVSVDVWNTNDAPVANADVIHADAGAASVKVAIADLLGNDADIDGDRLHIAGVHDALGGTARIEGDHVVFSSQAGLSQEGSFSYSITDGKGGYAVGSVKIDLRPQAEPLAKDQEVADDALSTPVVEDGAFETYVPAPLTDVQHTGEEPGTATELQVSPNDPNPPAPLDYSIADGGIDAALAGLDGPVETQVNQPVSLDASGLVSEEPGGEAAPLELVDVINPTHGEVAIEDGKVVFTPEQDFTGEATFEYVVADADGSTSTATVTVSVGAPDMSTLVADADGTTAAP